MAETHPHRASASGHVRTLGQWKGFTPLPLPHPGNGRATTSGARSVLRWRGWVSLVLTLSASPPPSLGLRVAPQARAASSPDRTGRRARRHLPVPGPGAHGVPGPESRSRVGPASLLGCGVVAALRALCSHRLQGTHSLRDRAGSGMCHMLLLQRGQSFPECFKGLVWVPGDISIQCRGSGGWGRGEEAAGEAGKKKSCSWRCFEVEGIVVPSSA